MNKSYIFMGFQVANHMYNERKKFRPSQDNIFIKGFLTK